MYVNKKCYFCKPKGRFFWFTFGICMVRIRYANQKSLCLQWKCGLGLEMALSVDARRGSAPCRWAFPGVLFIIKKMLERNFGNFEKKIILTTKTIPTMQRNKKNFQMTKHLHRDLSTTNQKNRPFGFLQPGIFCILLPRRKANWITGSKSKPDGKSITW